MSRRLLAVSRGLQQVAAPALPTLKVAVPRIHPSAVSRHSRLWTPRWRRVPTDLDAGRLWGSERRAWVSTRPGSTMLTRCFVSSTAFWQHLLDSLCAPVAPKTSRTSATAPDSSPPRSTPVGVKYSSEPVSGRSRRGDHVSKRINRVGGGTRPITPRATDLGDFLLVA